MLPTAQFLPVIVRIFQNILVVDDVSSAAEPLSENVVDVHPSKSDNSYER